MFIDWSTIMKTLVGFIGRQASRLAGLALLIGGGAAAAALAPRAPQATERNSSRGFGVSNYVSRQHAALLNYSSIPRKPSGRTRVYEYILQINLLPTYM